MCKLLHAGKTDIANTSQVIHDITVAEASLEEGAGRPEREQRAHQTSGREAHDELVDNDGLRVQMRAHSVGAKVSMTIGNLSARVFFLEARGIVQ